MNWTILIILILSSLLIHEISIVHDINSKHTLGQLVNELLLDSLKHCILQPMLQTKQLYHDIL